MKKNTKNTIRNVAIGTGIAAVVGAAYVLRDNPKIKKVTDAMKKEIIREAKKVDKEAQKVVKKIKKSIRETKKA
jgi:hypothetical protein